MFESRETAGEKLAARLDAYMPYTPDVVLGVPRGGLPVARPVADMFNATLDIVAAKKLTEPRTGSDTSIGAVSVNGATWMDDTAHHNTRIPESYIKEERDRAKTLAQEKASTYHDVSPRQSLDNQTVVIVDDGIATGATMHACVQDVIERHAHRIIVAVPVSHPHSLENVQQHADNALALLAPETFRAVSDYYTDFTQVTDREAQSYLKP